MKINNSKIKEGLQYIMKGLGKMYDSPKTLLMILTIDIVTQEVFIANGIEAGTIIFR